MCNFSKTSYRKIVLCPKSQLCLTEYTNFYFSFNVSLHLGSLDYRLFDFAFVLVYLIELLLLLIPSLKNTFRPMKARSVDDPENGALEHGSIGHGAIRHVAIGHN